MSAQTTNTQFDLDGYSESDQAAVLDMAKQMGRLGETIKKPRYRLGAGNI